VKRNLVAILHICYHDGVDEPAESVAAVIEPSLAADLRILIGKLRRRLREETQPGDLTPSQTAVLGRLERDGPATVTTLARAEGVRSQSMGAIVAALEEASLVVGTPDPLDRRQTILSLTPDCRRMIQANRAAREDWLLLAIRTRLTPAEQRELAAAVLLLKRLASP
jgi:DNA-binding MarR family transcriptional regulator